MQVTISSVFWGDFTRIVPYRCYQRNYHWLLTTGFLVILLFVLFCNRALFADFALFSGFDAALVSALLAVGFGLFAAGWEPLLFCCFVFVSIAFSTKRQVGAQ